MSQASCRVSKTLVHVVGVNNSYVYELMLHPRNTLLVAMFHRSRDRRMQAICNCRTLPATVGVGRLPSWCHNSGKDSITVNLSFRFEESKQYQSYPACLPSTLERRAVLSEGTLYFAQTTDRISKKQQTALYATMFVNSLGRDRTLPLSYLYFCSILF